MKTCFSIMPFEGFEDIDAIISQAATICELQYVRCDRRLRPGNILSQVLQDIRSAAVVVADISENNPNVFYELGIAHHIKGPDRVVILNRRVKHSPYDVHQFNQLSYQNSEGGREELRRRLPDLVRAASRTADQEVWDVIRGRLPRTRHLVRDLEGLVKLAGPRMDAVTIRIAAGLSSVSISDHEPADPGVDAEYFEHLIAERNALRVALLAGARLKAVLNPPRRFSRAMLPNRLRVRYHRLIGLLEGRSDIDDPETADADVRAMRQCEFVLSPVPMPNVFIIGEKVAYEGMKRAGTGGFEMTHCETNTEGLQELIRQFDHLFEDSRRDMIGMHPPDGRLLEQLRGFFHEAMSGAAGE